jgi:GNAT superfamily N-acetyltransferase
VNIKKVEKADLEEIIALAVAAFHDTPLYRYIAPDVGEREVMLRIFFGMRFHGGFGTNVMDAAYAAAQAAAEEGGRIIGAASWTPPAAPQAASASQPASAPAEQTKRMRARFEEPMTQAGVSEPALNRCMELLQSLAVNAAKNPQEPHWQLSPVFIHPDFQGKGIGSALMRKQFAVIDKAKLPITLSTQEQGNVELYQHLGFKLTSETPIGNSKVQSYGMYKPPGAA